MTFVEWGLVAILLMVFAGPFLVPKIEHNLEIFLFIMGCVAMTLSASWSGHIIHEALVEPLPISGVVLGAGFAFKWSRKKLEKGIQRLLTIIPLPLFIFLLVVVLGLIASVITAIIAALILVEFIAILKLNRKAEINITIIACFSIGLGAALTPLGEPLSTIIVSKMRQDFWYMARNFAYLIIPPIFCLGLFAPWFQNRQSAQADIVSWKSEDSVKTVILRGAKVYLFVMALIFLGSGFKPLIEHYLIQLPNGVLFWMNITSAVLDNATLAAAEVNPALSLTQMKSILMALLISGGMLIPGNIPNIIAANKLKIKSRDWAKLGLPLGFAMLMVYFIILEVL